MKRTALALCVLGLMGARVAVAQPAHADTDEGKRLFRVNCAGCHKWHGNGGGGYGGAALSLRKTQLDRDQIIETAECGRPGTGMPYFLRDAYAEHPCYGVTREQLGKEMPMAANNFLRPSEIGTIADYVLAHIKGHGAPTYAECMDFFGEGSRACNVYREHGSGASDSGASNSGAKP